MKINHGNKVASEKIFQPQITYIHVNQLMKKANEYQSKLCVGYIDFEKAFDYVEHSDFFTA